MIYSYCIAINMARDEDFIVLTLQYSHQSVSLSRRRLTYCTTRTSLCHRDDHHPHVIARYKETIVTIANREEEVGRTIAA